MTNNFQTIKIGETNINYQNLKMTIINYRNSDDIDIKFEDGIIINNRSYEAFKTGKIKNPNPHKFHIGETNIANNGQKMTIVDYKGFASVDIEFEDGTIVKSKCYRDFKSGKVKNPNYYKDSVERTGETNIANNGQEMTIIKYHNTNNIDIKFEDGTIVTNKSYINFQRGEIENPNCTNQKISFPEAVLLYYLRKINFDKFYQGYFLKFNKKFGKKEIDLFNEKLMIGIEYDGYFFHKNKKEKDIEKNKLCESSNIFLIRIREKGLPKLNTSNCIEIYRKTDRSNSELESIINEIISIINKKYNKKYKIKINIEKDLKKILNFYKKLKNMNDYNKFIGKEILNKQNLKMKIIDYNGYKYVNVEFEDGTIVKNKYYRDFKSGNIMNPNYYKAAIERTGKTNTANNGQKMTIINYRGATDIDIEFEDGTIVTNKNYHDFKKGNIKNPNYYKAAIERTGKTNTANNGQKITIINYRNSDNIDVKFEDGTIVTNTTYQDFKAGYTSRKKTISERINQTNINDQGLKMTIINYIDSRNCDIEFEDGTIVTNKSYYNFKKGNIKNPKIQKNNKIKLQKINQSIIATNGQKMTIIDYRRKNDLDVKFEDGTIVKNKTYSSFKKGKIKNPNYYKDAVERTGETNIANNGQKMTIIKYHNTNNIDIEFEDGTIVTNKNYHNFKKGKVKNPNFKKQ